MTSMLLVLLTTSVPALASDPLMTEQAEGPGLPDQDADPSFEDAESVEIDSQIVNGEATLAFPQVAALSAQYSTIDDSYCSATLISPTELVTAAHCVDALRGNVRNGAVNYAVFGGNIESGEITFASEIVEWGSHPDWNGDVRYGGDIAWLRMAEANTLVEPVGLFAGSVGSLQSGELFDFVGFGITGDNRRDSGVKRTAAIPYREVKGAFLISRDDTKNVCSGDSGGAALRREGEGQWSLAGVNSYVSDTAGDGTSCFTGENGSSRVDLYREWLMSYTDATTTLAAPVDPDVVGGLDDADKYGDWDLPQRPPEGSVKACSSVGGGAFGGLGLALAGLLLLRRRRG